MKGIFTFSILLIFFPFTGTTGDVKDEDAQLAQPSTQEGFLNYKLDNYFIKNNVPYYYHDLVHKLQSSDSNEQLDAVSTILTMSSVHPVVFQLLNRLISSPSASLMVRLLALHAVAVHHNVNISMAKNTMLKALQDRVFSVRQYAIKNLVIIDKMLAHHIYHTISDFILDPHVQVQKTAIEVLQSHVVLDSYIAKNLIESVNRSFPIVKRDAIRLLVQYPSLILNHSEFRNQLSKIVMPVSINSQPVMQDDSVRLLSVWALKTLYIHDSAVQELLFKVAMTDPTPYLRLEALLSLGVKQFDNNAKQAWMDTLFNLEKRIQQLESVSAYKKKHYITNDSDNDLDLQVEELFEVFRVISVWMLGQMFDFNKPADAWMVQNLMQSLYDPSERVRGQALVVLNNLRLLPPKAIFALRGEYDSDNQARNIQTHSLNKNSSCKIIFKNKKFAKTNSIF